MPCPKDGTEYFKIDNLRICLKCGHCAGHRPMDTVHLLLGKYLKLKDEMEKNNRISNIFMESILHKE